MLHSFFKCDTLLPVQSANSIDEERISQDTNTAIRLASGRVRNKGIMQRACGPRELNPYSGSLRARRSWDRILVETNFSAPALGPNQPRMHRVRLPGVKREGRGANHPLPSCADVKEKVELYPYFRSGPSRSVLGRRNFFKQLAY